MDNAVQPWIALIYIVPALILCGALAFFIMKMIKPFTKFLEERGKSHDIVTPPIFPQGLVWPFQQPNSSPQEIKKTKEEIEKEELQKFEERKAQFIAPNIKKKVKVNFDNLGEKIVSSSKDVNKAVKYLKKKKGEK